MKSQAKALFIAFSFVWVACQQAPSSGPLRRLQPATLQSAALPGALALVDRDTTTGTLVQGRAEVKVSFPRDFDTALVKVFADGPIDVSLGEQQVRAEPGQWSRLSLETPHRGRQVTLVLEAAGARLTELELWGTGHRSAPRDPRLLAALSERVEDGAFDDLRIFRANPASRKLTPVGLGHGTACTQVELRAPTADVDLPAVARAFLVYEAVGVPRSISLRRSINGAEPVGGLWLPGGDAERTLVDELNPRELSSQSLVTLCLPTSAERPVSIRNLRVVALLDDGALTFDRNVASVLQEAVDGSARTTQLLPAGTYSVGLSRTVAIDELTAEVSLVPAAASGRFFAGGQPLELGALPLVRGTNAIAPPALPVDGFELTLTGPARADIPAAELSELTLVGSPVGRRMSSSALVVSYPQLRLRDGKLRGERFGATGYVAGWAESPAGPGVVEIDGAIVSGSNGQFSTQLQRSSTPGTSWKVTVVARFPDGTTTTRELHLDDDRESELLAAQGAEVLAQDEARRYGREDETAWGRVRKEGGTVTLGSDVLFEAPVGAVEGDVSVGIQRKGRESIPPLEPGMINVTAPTGGAYRFHPPGQVFKVPVAITLPYDPLLLPEGTPDEEIRTYYYDKKESRWVVLERKSVRRDTRQIVSETTHFTFMVNAVLVTPDHPGPVSFDPNSIKDIATADPAAGIDFIEPPIGGWDGNAKVTFPLRLPKARGGYQPRLALSYDSSAGNGWLGMGWNLAVPSVGIDTRFGAARYDGQDRYTYAGEQLIPGGSSASGCLVGGNGRRYYPRVEGAFSRILRCGAGPGSYHFEITEKDGTLFVFGASDDARVRKAGGPIGEWLLERVVDASGNLTVFRYAPDYNGAPATHALPGHVETRFYESKTTELSQAGIITRQRYQYDGVGNVKVFEDLGQDDDPDDDFHAELQYANDDAALGIYSIDRAEHMWVRADAFGEAGALLRERWATFDTAGNTHTLTERIDSSHTATTKLTWEDGLLKSFVGPGSAANDQYSIHYDEYDATRTFPRVIRDAFGHTSISEYDPGLGAPTLTRDIAGNTTEWRYDEFGRAQKVFGPKDTGPDATPLIEFSYHHQVTAAMPLAWSKTSHKLPRTFVPTDGSLDTLMFVDGLRRVIQVQKDATVEGQGPGRTASGSVAFNAMGKLERQGQPCFRALGAPFEECPELHPTVQEYDVVGRITQATAPTNRSTRSLYDLAAPGGVGPKRWRVTVTDPLVQKRVMFRDASERVVAIEDHLDGRTPRTTYEFSRLGELEKIKDAANNETTLTYDLLGRRTSVDNRDTGKTEFRYDAAGNLTDRITANLRLRNQSIHYVYKLNRLERVEYPDSTPIRFFYGTSGNDTQRIVRIEDEAGAEEKHYGALGETIEMTRTVRALKPGDSPISLVTRFSFDEFGRSLTVQYPDGELLSYGYDEGGLLRAARGQRPAMGRRPAETETYLEKLGYDVFGQRVALQLGNGVQTRFTYEPDTRRLKTIQTGTSHGRTLQALTYTYDDADNITDVVNALGAATPQRAGGVRFKYTYDELYRLTSAEGWAAARPGVTDHFFSEFQYSDIHNLDRKTQKRELIKTLSLDQTVERPDHSNHDWSYAYGGRGPHQAVRIGETALSYDLNGNQVVECRSPLGEVCVGTPEASEPNAIISHDHLRRYAWNEENWLKSVTIGGGQNVTRFLYDGRGERVVKQGHSGTTINAGQFYSLKNKVYGTKHIFAGNTRLVSKLQPLPPSGAGDPTDTDPPPLEDREPNDNGCEPSGDKPRKCTLPIGGGNGAGGAYSNFRPVSYYFHSDHLGSSTVLTDQFARVQERVEYYPFGELWREDREDRVGNLRRTQQFLFTSKPFDEETGLTYFGARYFDSRRVRWLSTDPDWMSQGVIGLNVYQYVDWDPIGNVDPDGRGLLRIGYKVSKALFKKVVKGADKVDEFVDLYESWTVLTTPSAGFGAHLGASLSIASEILPVSAGDAKDVYRWGKRLLEGGKEIAQKADNVPVKKLDEAVEATNRAADGAGEATHRTFTVGPHAGESIPARSTAQKFTTAERAEIDRIGQTTGCHTCGTTNPGTKRGHFVPDHQPPSALNTDNAPQRLYPHCIDCSRNQGLAIARERRGQ